MMGHSALVLFALATMAVAVDKEIPSLSHNQIAVGQRFSIQTADCAFRCQLVDRSTGECLVSTSADGQDFAPSRTVYVLGATAGPDGGQMLVLMRQIKVGWKMELAVDDLEQKNRLVTSEVKSIRLDP